MTLSFVYMIVFVNNFLPLSLKSYVPNATVILNSGTYVTKPDISITCSFVIGLSVAVVSSQPSIKLTMITGGYFYSLTKVPMASLYN